MIEIFYKAQWFLDTHYRSWLVAQQIHRNQYGEPLKCWQPIEKSAFLGPLDLFEFKDPLLRDVLPRKFEPVDLHLLYVKSNGDIDELCFTFEREMIPMLITRSSTHGQSTDLFEHKNIHIDLSMYKEELDRPYLGIGLDIQHEIEFGEIKTRISHLDTILAINCQERFEHLS